MRSLILVIAAALLTASFLDATPSFAAKKQVQVRSRDACVKLARSRGFTYQDLNREQGTRADVRRFVRDCMNGTQH